jgi:hypothetical protein
LRFQIPSRSICTAAGTRRASESISAKVCSVAAIEFAPGVLRTRIPASVAAATSIASTPTPARATTESFGPAASSSRSDDQPVRDGQRGGERLARLADLRVDLDPGIAQHG